MPREGGVGGEGLQARPDREDEGELQAMVEHWIAAIDRWVRSFDEGMGNPAAEDPETETPKA